MNANPTLTGYNQDDVQTLYSMGSIVPSIDSYGNLIIQNIQGQLYSSSIMIPLQNVVYDPTKVETKYDVTFKEL
jgi:hypothetical protein